MKKIKTLLSIFLISFIPFSYSKTICVDMDMQNKEAIKYSLTVKKESKVSNEKSIVHITKYNQSSLQFFDITETQPKEMNTQHSLRYKYDYLKETNVYIGFYSIDNKMKNSICDYNIFLNQQEKTVLLGNNISATFRLE